MPIQTHCPSCQAKYTLVDALAGKYVRCERCRQSFRVAPLPTEPDFSATPVPPTISTPDVPVILPPTIVKTGNRAHTKPPPRPTRSSDTFGRSGLPIGLIFVAFMVLRGCISFSSRSRDHSYDSRPTVSVQRFNPPVWKDRGDGKVFP